MRKSISLVLLVILTMTVPLASAQTVEELNKKLRGWVTVGDIDEVKRLIEAGADVYHRFDFGATKDITVIVFAVMSGRTEMVKVLIDADANVNDKYEGGITLLHLASQWNLNDTGVTEVLIAAGSDVNAKINKGSLKGVTPLHNSAVFSNIGVAEVLIKNGADVNAKDDEGRTPLDLATEKNHEKVAELLRKHGGKSGKK